MRLPNLCTGCATELDSFRDIVAIEFCLLLYVIIIFEQNLLK